MDCSIGVIFYVTNIRISQITLNVLFVSACDTRISEFLTASFEVEYVR